MECSRWNNREHWDESFGERIEMSGVEKDWRERKRGKHMDREKYRKAAEALVAQMTVDEAASQLLHHAPAIERLGVPEYNWWNEALHGVARAGIATVFPQAIAMAAAFDSEFLEKEAQVIAEEARAKYNAAQEEGDCDLYKGLTLWSPNINIFRDPRWGRGHETYGEDPMLTGELGKAFIRGLQGDEKYLKTAACAKHLAVHSGPEALRHEFDAVVSEKDLRETYLPAFEAAVKEASVEAVMGAYNKVNGEPACGSRRLLVDILRGEWGFDGHVVSDCWAVKNFHETHHYTDSPEESASLAVRMGCDLNCGCTYERLLEGLKQGLITEEEIRQSAVRVFTTRYALGMFDPDCEFNRIPYTVVSQLSHKKAALKAAEESIVLLKNDGVLPLNKGQLKSLAVIGPNAYSRSVLYANYHGDSDEYVTNLDGIRRLAGEDIRIFYSQGCDLSRMADDPICRPGRLLGEAVAAARCADVVILCVGLDETLEGEQGDAGNSYASGDKENLLLPQVQQLLIEKLLGLDKKIVLVVNSGSALDLSAYESKVSAIVQAWYSGQEGGNALARVLFGESNPSGKLPVTFYYNGQPMPEITDYHMKGRTYKFVESAPWYPFGYGLSYSRFMYHDPQVRVEGVNLNVSVTVENNSLRDGAEISECYIRYEGEAFEKPHHKLVGFQRSEIKAGEKKSIQVSVPLKELYSVQKDGSAVLQDGTYTLFVGGCQPDERSVELLNQKPLAIGLEVLAGNINVTGSADCEPYCYPDRKDYAARMGEQRKYSLDTLFSELCANEEILRLMTEIFPFFFSDRNPYAEQMKKLNIGLKEIAAMAGEMMPGDKLKELDRRLKQYG